MTWAITAGDARTVLAGWPAGAVQTICTSPPYWGLRAYGTQPQVWGGRDDCAHEWGAAPRRLAVGNNSGVRGQHETVSRLTGGTAKAVQDGNQRTIEAGAFCAACGAWRGELGSEPTLDQYVANLVTVFRAVRRVLAPSGTLWLNIGDSYSNDGKWGGRSGGKNYTSALGGYAEVRKTRKAGTVGPKQLLLVPARVALALQSDGWILRADVIWAKPNAMPESVTDRPTKSHEHLFLFSQQARYYYDAAAIAEPAVRPGDIQTFGGMKGRAYTPAPDDPNYRHGAEQWGRTVTCAETRNARDVWTIATEPYAGAHFAVMPTDLARRCILAGSRPGDVVADPFTGAGTVGVVALRHGRAFWGAELNPAYCDMARARIIADAPLFNQATEGAA